MKLIFLGTPSFAATALGRIVSAGHEVMAVFTQPDRPKGRGRRESAPPVKRDAIGWGIPVRQPEKVRAPEVLVELRRMAPEAMVVVGYGQIIPQAILDIPPQGIINVHASLLPKYRGAAPIQWAIARGETRTGVTTMKIDAGLDTGDMLLKWETPIGPEETGAELAERLAEAGADLLVRTLAELPNLRPEPQDHTQASFAPILKRNDGQVDWRLSSSEILNRIRGFTPWPGGFGWLRGRRFHIWKGSPSELKFAPGALAVKDRRLYAGSSDGAIELLEVQMEGRSRMPASAFLNGFQLAENEALK